MCTSTFTMLQPCTELHFIQLRTLLSVGTGLLCFRVSVFLYVHWNKVGGGSLCDSRSWGALPVLRPNVC